jgi:hypothetical protein
MGTRIPDGQGSPLGPTPIPTEAVGGRALRRLRGGEVSSQHGSGIPTEAADARRWEERTACAAKKIEMRSMGFELG